jgi:hypothetical protein
MTPHPYVGNGPYCYANSFSMMFGNAGPSAAVIQVAVGGPFGMQLIGGKTMFFDAYGWNPGLGFDPALDAIGWTSTETKGGEPDEALARLAKAAANGPVWVGPLEMGLFRHQPEMRGPIGADHYVVVLDVDQERVLIHDPQGYPYAEVPIDEFLTAWRAETIDYGEPFTMRTDFVKVADVSAADAIRASIPNAIEWLSMRRGEDMPAGSLGNGDAAERVASMIADGANDGLREHLMYFAIRAGARGLSDTADCLRMAGLDRAATIAAEQARLIGSMQRPIATGDLPRAAAALRELAPTYDRLLAALEQNT